MDASRRTRVLTAHLAAHPLTIDTLNPRLKAAEYAVRGELVIKAGEYEQALTRGEKLNFEKVIYCNIGNPHSVKQSPLTFHRQVLSLCLYPDAMDSPEAMRAYPTDAVQRAVEILKGTGGNGLGAYSHSKGLLSVRHTIAEFLEARDGFPADPERLFLTNGASEGVGRLFDMLVCSSNDGVMIPIPQYPLYSSSLALRGAVQVPYYLDEEKGWGMDINELARALQKARAQGVNVKALCVINPGNPTGQVLDYDSMAAIVKFCADQGLVLCADEVYQENVYDENKQWTSFRKVMLETKVQAQLFSYHSTSKGFFGECGLRGGFFEVLNVEDDVMAQLYKLSSMGLCSNLTGQVMTDLMLKPPKAWDPSGPLFLKERDTQLSSLKRRAKIISDGLNSLSGVSCNPSEGAMYTFPQIRLPAKAISAAQAAGKAPDAYYALALLAATGICVVPGSGFGQKDGTWHFRSTFLPPENDIEDAVERMRQFHEGFMAKYA